MFRLNNYVRQYCVHCDLPANVHLFSWTQITFILQCVWEGGELCGYSFSSQLIHVNCNWWNNNLSGNWCEMKWVWISSEMIFLGYFECSTSEYNTFNFKIALACDIFRVLFFCSWSGPTSTFDISLNLQFDLIFILFLSENSLDMFKHFSVISNFYQWFFDNFRRNIFPFISYDFAVMTICEAALAFGNFLWLFWHFAHVLSPHIHWQHMWFHQQWDCS